MTQYLNKDDLVAEIERRRKLVSDPILSGDDLMIGERNALFNLLSFIDTLEVKKLDLDNYNKVKRILSLSFMNFLDTNCPEGKMCLSNGECFDIDKAFDELDFAKLFRYMEKYFKTQKEIN